MKHVCLIGKTEHLENIKLDIFKNHPEVSIMECIDINKTSLANIQIPEETEEMVLVISENNGKLIRKILLNLPQKRFAIKYIPVSNEIKLSYKRQRELIPEDFLSRPLNIPYSELHRKYYGLKVLVYGGAGSIGSEIVQQLLNLGVKQVIIYDSCEYSVFKLAKHLELKNVPSNQYKIILGNILNREKLKKILKQTLPDMIIHAAAYKHVHLMEQNIDEAILTNLEGTKNIVDTAIEAKIKELIFISTDKVVNPRNIMGATKRLSEDYINQINSDETKINIVRFGNVIKSRGSVIPIWEYQLLKGFPLTITDSQAKRFFISIPEAAMLVLSTKLYNSNKEVFILNMGDLVPINDVALCLIRSKGFIPYTDAKIEYIGLKQEEKLFEELFTEEEWKNVEPTQNNNIYHLKKFGREFKNIESILENLIKDAKNQKSQEYLRKQFCLLFPSLSKEI